MKKIAIAGMFAVALLFAGILIAPARAQVLGGYKTIATDDAGAVAAADFAVSKEEETNEGIKLDEILKAERQSVAGSNYRLCLKVSLGEESQEVEAIVYQDLKGNDTLKSWTPKECGDK